MELVYKLIHKTKKLYSHSSEKTGIWPNKIHAWKNHGISKKGHFHKKSWDFVSVIHIFF